MKNITPMLAVVFGLLFVIMTYEVWEEKKDLDAANAALHSAQARLDKEKQRNDLLAFEIKNSKCPGLLEGLAGRVDKELQRRIFGE